MCSCHETTRREAEDKASLLFFPFLLLLLLLFLFLFLHIPHDTTLRKVEWGKPRKERGHVHLHNAIARMVWNLPCPCLPSKLIATQVVFDWPVLASVAIKKEGRWTNSPRRGLMCYETHYSLFTYIEKKLTHTATKRK